VGLGDVHDRDARLPYSSTQLILLLSVTSRAIASHAAVQLCEEESRMIRSIGLPRWLRHRVIVSARRRRHRRAGDPADKPQPAGGGAHFFRVEDGTPLLEPTKRFAMRDRR
jgi:hypothetical protein